MKIVCAPDKFKVSLTADEAAHAMARGVRRVFADATIEHCPVSDGGEGFVEAIVGAGSGEIARRKVRGPLPELEISARIGLTDQSVQIPDDVTLTEQERLHLKCYRCAVIEMSAASGLALVPDARRDPTQTTTFGTGQLIRAARDSLRCRRILIGIGGSATTDGGCGMAQAMGVRFFHKDGEFPFDQPIVGGDIAHITRIENVEAVKHRCGGCDITIACDVTNPLTGPHGAAHVYGPQKGATPEQVKQLDEGLAHLAQLCREQLGVDHEHTPGAGAAGGLGFGLMTFLGATLQPGIDLVLDAIRFDDRLRGADLCLTGEGKLDGQSLAGKACIGVAKAARKQGVPTIALVGAATDDANQAVKDGLLQAYHRIGEGLPAEQSMREARELLERTTADVCRMFFDGGR